MEKKAVPVGVENFEEIIKENYYLFSYINRWKKLQNRKLRKNLHNFEKKSGKKKRLVFTGLFSSC